MPLAQEAAFCEQPAPLTCEDTSIPKQSSSPQSLERNESETFRKVTDFSDAFLAPSNEFLLLVCLREAAASEATAVLQETLATPGLAQPKTI